MKINLTLLFILAVSINSIFAQDNYTVLEDDPDYAQLMIQLGIGFETDFGFRSEVPFDISAYYHFENIPLEISIARNFSVASERKSSFYIDNISNNDFQAYSRLDIGGTFNFKDLKNSERIMVKMKTSTRGNTRTNYYLDAEGQRRKRLGARFGAYRYAQSITDYDAVDQSIEFEDGTTFPSADNAWDNKPSTDDDYFFTGERHLAGYIGIGLHNSTGLVIDHESYGIRDEQGNTFYYADVMFNLSSDIQKLSYEGQLYDLNEATSGVNLKNVGFRIGAKRVETHIYYSFEFGQRPQYFKPAFYANITLGYSFNKNI